MGDIVFDRLERAFSACSGCGVCVDRCEVLSDAGISSLRDLIEPFRGEPSLDAVRSVPELALAVRRCCMCGSCTCSCPTDVDARSVLASLREVLARVGATTMEGFESTQVDKEWHIFSVYRAVHGIGYADLPSWESARELGSDTLFFPGCTLASYAPELTREVFSFLQDRGMNPVISTDCCGSPLKSGGLGERVRAYKSDMVRRAREAGIAKVVFACPGCRDEFSETEESEGMEFVALPRLLADAGVKIGKDRVLAAAGSSTGAMARAAVFDSCHDRDGAFGGPLRSLFEEGALCELPHCGQRALCCGAGGAVSLVDPDLCARRAHRILDDEASSVGAAVLVSNCPTCSYTFAAQLRADERAGAADAPVRSLNYLELAFENGFDWDLAFYQLETMWSGEYGAWVCQQLLG